MKARALLFGVLLALLAVPVPARADTTNVSIADFAFSPPDVPILSGDTVGWRNGSFVMQHTVTGNGFDSGPIVPGGGFFHDFDAAGIYLYACTIHPFMTGEVDVYDLFLSGPGREVARGAPTTLTGRAAAGVKAVTIEEDAGGGFHPVSSAQASAGSFKATIRPQATALYRAVSGASVSPSVQVQVSNRSQVTAAVSRRRLRVSVEPAGAKVSLQLELRERFGWWTVARARLGARSRASFPIRLHRRVPARVALTQSDGWTLVATSGVVRVGPRRSK